MEKSIRAINQKQIKQIEEDTAIVAVCGKYPRIAFCSLRILHLNIANNEAQGFAESSMTPQLKLFFTFLQDQIVIVEHSIVKSKSKQPNYCTSTSALVVNTETSDLCPLCKQLHDKCLNANGDNHCHRLLNIEQSEHTRSSQAALTIRQEFSKKETLTCLVDIGPQKSFIRKNIAVTVSGCWLDSQTTQCVDFVKMKGTTLSNSSSKGRNRRKV
ncbi:hypothetical protein T11_437 [Trichinella zimbabwensis]|uniref:Uncharacterized protein n=1 Tax=Trichinella zimbabwensis TaxID=268475 RepID=A0A0V1I2P4_9BILA|nr:hypothetical protein T11_437 [Trichinella zimbabwensis]